MKNKKSKLPPQEFIDFDKAMEKILSVSHGDLKAREEQWKRERKAENKKRAKKQPASDHA